VFPNFRIFCVVCFVFCFVCLLPVLSMHNVASVSGLSIFDFHSVFSDVYILLVLHFCDSIGVLVLQYVIQVTQSIF
jgi:hypothetical protein